MEFNNYDAGSDVEGFFPEEFRKYVRDLNLFCRYKNESDFGDCNRFWVFRNKHESDEADRDITDKLAKLVDADINVLEQCLVQFWRAQEVTSIGNIGERRFRLTTRNQPFIFMTGNDETPFSEGICSYRMKMVDFITGDGGGGGVIGRVFRNNRAECTPNIGYYSYEEYSHRDLALSCHIKSSLAIPLFDSSGRSVGVVEIVSSVEPYLFAQDCLGDSLLDCLEYCDCSEDICEQYDSLKMAVSEIEEVMRLVGRSCLVCAQTWMLCNRCSYLSTVKRLDPDLGGFYKQEYFEYDVWSDLLTLKTGEGVVGKAATSSYNLVYCDDVSQFSITEYPMAHFARYHKLTACFATCLRSNHTGNQIYVIEFFLNPSKVNGSGPRAILVPILQGMRKEFRTFMLASGEEVGDNLSVQVIDAGSPDKFEILEIGKLDSVQNNTFEMDLIHNDVNVVNTIEEGVAIASLDKQHNSFEISAGNRGGELAVDGLAIDNGENMGNNIGEQPVAIASRENRHNNATISSIGVINSNISLQPLVESNVVHTEENVGGAAKMLNGELPPRNGIDISLEELMEVSGMKRKDAAKRLNVIESTFKRVRRHYKIPRWPPRKKNLDQSRSEILEIGKLDSVENNTLEMNLIHNDVNVVNTIEEGVAIALLDKQHNSFEISAGNRGRELAVDGLAINNGENMGNNSGEQPVAIASRENQHNNATISCDEGGGELAIGVINSDISQQPLVEANVVHTEETVSGVSEECIINSSKLPPRNGIDISLEDLEKVSGMKREGAAERLNVSVSTFKRVCRHYGINRWPPRKKNLDHSRSGNSAQTGSTKELGGSAPTVQNEIFVTIKAKYGDNFIKFKLPASSGINAFNQQVSKRLELEAGSYVVKYQDEDNDWILVACDDDLRDYISSSVSLGKTTLIMFLEHI